MCEKRKLVQKTADTCPTGASKMGSRNEIRVGRKIWKHEGAGAHLSLQMSVNHNYDHDVRYSGSKSMFCCHVTSCDNHAASEKRYSINKLSYILFLLLLRLTNIKSNDRTTHTLSSSFLISGRSNESDCLCLASLPHLGGSIASSHPNTYATWLPCSQQWVSFKDSSQVFP
jgi:hypothetical protein